MPSSHLLPCTIGLFLHKHSIKDKKRFFLLAHFRCRFGILIGSMIVPMRVFTSGFVKLKNELLLFHSLPSGFRIARSYYSRDVNGNGTPSTRIARSLASAF